MKIWCMNLIDNREQESRCKDKELKFRICREKSILAIGWGLSAEFDSWQDYKNLADIFYKDNKGYLSAIAAIQKISCKDLVWTQNPVTNERYLAQVIDSPPSLCCNLREFDLFSCRKAEFYKVDMELLERCGLSGQKLSGRQTIEQIHGQNIIDATIQLFELLKQSRV